MTKRTPRKWLVCRSNLEYVEYVSRLASVSLPFAQVLINRGIKTPEQIQTFLNPHREQLSDPMELPGIREAIERIRLAKERGEIVLIHGDYDADGISATAIMVEGLRQLGIESRYFIPNRGLHGYGFGAAGVECARKSGAALIITVDCGIGSFDACSEARRHGIDVVITDHHEPVRSPEPQDAGTETPACLTPEAVAVVNPRLMSGLSPLRDLSGAGVAFSIVRALLGPHSDAVFPLFDLAALGTAADVVPVFGDNRIMLREGMRLIHSRQRPGIRALKEVSGVRSDVIRTSILNFTLIPRINAAGRIDDATDVVTLLTTELWAEAERLALWLNELNARRQRVEESVYQEALQLLERIDVDRCGAIVLASEGWHPGVVGIVASRIAEEHQRPTFILAIEDGVAKGSGRSIPVFDMHHGLSRCSGLLTRFGGHRQAAGLSLSADMIETFTTAISGIALDALSKEDCTPSLRLDASVTLADVTTTLTAEIARLEPFGYGNEEPLFGARGLEAVVPRTVGNNHLKMHLKQESVSLDTIGFDMGGLLGSLGKGMRFDAAFLPLVNEWNGGRFLQLNLKALRRSS
ncbi:MAG TPA: single-stranded-DNA-specific exonuclease RecJ [Dissulfurispiraceae bacterium]|nr:single-stranded-DNA-specific exonuclease RecJ [Dissulfurispiraceae bacterium]